jgi:hypothetical protein
VSVVRCAPVRGGAAAKATDSKASSMYVRGGVYAHEDMCFKASVHAHEDMRHVTGIEGPATPRASISTGGGAPTSDRCGWCFFSQAAKRRHEMPACAGPVSLEKRAHGEGPTSLVVCLWVSHRI